MENYNFFGEDYPLDSSEYNDYSSLAVGPGESHIKVIGVGGGGCNVVEHILKTNIKDVDLVICNTDEQALKSNPVSGKLMLGSTGLGAGFDPVVGRRAAEESQEEIKKILEGNSELIFITACLGGGTGTGASPVIAKIAKEMGKLVVAVVTIPFRDEGPEFMNRALCGLKELKKVVDSSIIIDNQKLYNPYGDISTEAAYSKVNDVLITAVKGISDMVTISGKINLDMNDVRNVLSNSKTASLGIGQATMAEGIEKAVENALSFPLLNDCNLKTSQGALLCIYCDDTKLPFSANKQASEYVQNLTGKPAKYKKGLYVSKEYGDNIYVTVVVAGFKLENLPDGAIDADNPFFDEDGNIINGPIPEKEDKDKIVITELVNPETKEKIKNLEYKKIRGGEKPVLVANSDSEILQYEQEPAFIRKDRIRKEMSNSSTINSSDSYTIQHIENKNYFSTDNKYLHKTQD